MFWNIVELDWKYKTPEKEYVVQMCMHLLCLSDVKNKLKDFYLGIVKEIVAFFLIELWQGKCPHRGQKIYSNVYCVSVLFVFI